MDKILGRIHTGTKEICKDCDLVIEAAIENMQIKKQTFKELSEICKPDCLFATNTSSLSITEIGAGLDRPVTGMHFFNPAPVMKLVEVIYGLNTPQETVHRQDGCPDAGVRGLCREPYPDSDDQRGNRRLRGQRCPGREAG